MGAAKDMLTSALFLAVSINLFFVVLWEIGFYFLYVTKREDDISKKMATDMVDLFTSEMWQMVGKIPLPVRMPLLEVTLSELNRVAAATAKDDSDKEVRDKHNRKLMYYSLAMCAGFLVLVVIFGIMCGVRKIFPDQKHMWLELFVVMVGFVMFDFFFFDYIVKNFVPVSSGKFQRMLLQPTLDHIKCFPMQPLPSVDPARESYLAAAAALGGGVVSKLQQASTIKDLSGAASSLQDVIRTLSGAKLQVFTASLSAPSGTPSMPISADLQAAVGDAVSRLQHLSQQLSIAATLPSLSAFSGWVSQVNTYLTSMASALQNPTDSSILEALQALPALPDRPSA